MDRIHRLRSARDFSHALSSGARGQSGGVVCYALATGEAREPRVGVSVGRRLGGSVARNRAKRLLRESARRLLPSLPAGLDVVLTVTRGGAGKSYQIIAEETERALRRAGVPC